MTAIEVPNGTCSNVHFQCDLPFGIGGYSEGGTERSFVANREQNGLIGVAGKITHEQAIAFAHWILNGQD